MRQFGYQAIGFGVWQGGRLYLKRRFGAAPRLVALGGLVAALTAGLLVAGRKTTSD